MGTIYSSYSPKVVVRRIELSQRPKKKIIIQSHSVGAFLFNLLFVLLFFFFFFFKFENLLRNFHTAFDNNILFVQVMLVA